MRSTGLSSLSREVPSRYLSHRELWVLLPVPLRPRNRKPRPPRRLSRERQKRSLLPYLCQALLLRDQDQIVDRSLTGSVLGIDIRKTGRAVRVHIVPVGQILLRRIIVEGGDPHRGVIFDDTGRVDSLRLPVIHLCGTGLPDSAQADAEATLGGDIAGGHAIVDQLLRDIIQFEGILDPIQVHIRRDTGFFRVGLICVRDLQPHRVLRREFKADRLRIIDEGAEIADVLGSVRVKCRIHQLGGGIVTALEQAFIVLIDGGQIQGPGPTLFYLLQGLVQEGIHLDVLTRRGIDLIKVALHQHGGFQAEDFIHVRAGV